MVSNIIFRVNMGVFFLIGPLYVTKFDFLLFSGILSHFSLVFSLAATHPKCTPGSPPIFARTQRDGIKKNTYRSDRVEHRRVIALGFERAARDKHMLIGATLIRIRTDDLWLAMSR